MEKNIADNIKQIKMLKRIMADLEQRIEKIEEKLGIELFDEDD
jgi:ubiquinone biosynthesis protein UbiJ